MGRDGGTEGNYVYELFDIDITSGRDSRSEIIG